MLGLFSPKQVRSLADEKNRQRILGEIAGADALSALRNSVDWLRRLANAGSMPFGLRVTLVRQIEDTVQRSAPFVAREYLMTAHSSHADAMDLWRASRAFWAQLAAAYNACLTDFMRSADTAQIQRSELARLVVRLLRAYRARLKWDQFRYWPGSDTLWRNVGRAYLYALDNGFARREVSAYPGERPPTTAETEYLNALVFQISSMDALLPFEIEIAEQIIVRFSARFELGTEASAGFAFWVEPEERRVPGRVVGKPGRSASHLYFGTAAAAARLKEVLRALELGQLPEEFDFAPCRSPRILVSVVRHLLTYWSPHPAERLHERYRDQSKMAVVVGIDAVRSCLAASRMTVASATWNVENLSRGGMRARLPMGTEEQLRIGSVLAMRPEGGQQWLVGMVRRVARKDETQSWAGIETLSRNPMLATISAEAPYDAIILDLFEEGETVRVAVSSYEADGPLHADMLGSEAESFSFSAVEAKPTDGWGHFCAMPTHRDGTHNRR